MTPVAPALDLAAAVLRRRPVAVALVDGRSGSGKSTFAALLAARTGAEVLHLEDVYPGWDGLDAGADAAVQGVLVPRRSGAAGSVRRWDWAAGRPRGQVRLRPAGPLIVEGCGAIRPAASPFADLAVWIELDETCRRERALERDGDVFRPFWGRWAEQEARAIARDEPRRRAALHVDGRTIPGPLSARAADVQ